MKETKKEDVHMGKINCPVCEKLLDYSCPDLTDIKPQLIGIVICIGCGSMLNLFSDLVLKELTVYEFNQLEDETRRKLLETQFQIINSNGNLDNS